MTKEKIIKHLHEALNSVDITFPYRYVLVEAIEALSQPSLPSNLDEAAEESMPEEEGFLEIDIYGGSIAVYSREQMLAMYKAGAERMAGQFQKIEGELVDWYETNGVDYCHGISTDESFEVPEGFYIRKE